MSGPSFQKSIETPGSEQHPNCLACAASEANAAAASGSNLRGGFLGIVAVDAAMLPTPTDSAFCAVRLLCNPLVTLVCELASASGVECCAGVFIVALAKIERGAWLA